MAHAAPERAINSILIELTSLLDRVDTDSFQLRRNEALVERLWQQQAILPVEYYTGKAFIEFGKYHRQDAIDAALNLLRLAPSDPAAQCNALSIFVATLELDVALDRLKKMAKALRDDKDTVRTLIIKAADLLQYELAVELFEVLDQLSTNDAPQQYLRRPAIYRSYAAMKRTNLTDSDTAALLGAAYAAVRDESVEVWRTSRSVLMDGSVLYFLHVKADADQCASLTFSIADRLVEQFDDPGADLVSFSCRPITDLAELHGIPGGRV